MFSTLLTLSQTSPGIYVSAEQVFGKHCWKRRNLLVTSNFSFSHSLFYPFGEHSATVIQFEIIVLQTLSVWKRPKFVVWEKVNPFKFQILNSFKLKEFADYYFKFDENGRKFSKRVQNPVGKGEIACFEQFLLFPQCFQKTNTVDT